MDGDINIVVCKNKLSNIIKKKPNSVVKAEYEKFNQKDILEVINDTVIRTNKIVFHTYNFLKLYILHLHDKNITFPIINQDFVYTIMNIVSRRTEKAGRKPGAAKLEVIENLTLFYNEFYVQLIIQDDIMTDDKLSYILKNYESVDIVKNIDNNIKEHFIDHVRRYVNLLFKVKEKKQKIIDNASLTSIQKKEKVKKINERYNNIKYDILSSDSEYKSDEKFINKIQKIRKLILPYYDFIKESIFYDIKVNPQNYLKSMIILNKLIQDLNDERETNHKLFQVLPLRTSMVPKYITLDTAAIIQLFIGKAEYFKKISDLSNTIWGSVFNLEDKSFKRSGHKFIHMIKTDGVACSILLEKLTKLEKKIPKTYTTKVFKDHIDHRLATEEEKEMLRQDSENVSGKKIKRKIHNKEKDEVKKYNYEYIEEAKLSDEQKKKNFVFIDPGHNDLIKCLLGKNDDVMNKKKKRSKDVTFRYTREQRNREIKKERSRKISYRVKGEDIMYRETEMSNYNSKTCDFKKFRKYLKEKIKLNRLVCAHYETEIYRKLKFNTYTNTRKSESRMINNFKEKMGNPEETMIIFGDYDKQQTMKGSEPHISQRLKKIFVQNGYKLFLINEHNTSKLCNKCSCVTENVIKQNKKIWKLLRCTSGKCLTYHDRDMNAVRNMKKIVRSVMRGLGRPKEYSPQKEVPAECLSVRKPKIFMTIRNSTRFDNDSS